MNIPKTAEQRACKHNYNTCKVEDGGYWFRCKYCGHQIFGVLSKKPKNEVP